MIIQELVNVFKSRHIISYLIHQEQRVQHRDKVLGNIWMLLNPIMMMVVLFFVFNEMRHLDVTFCLYLFSGLLAWDIVSKSLVGCTVCLQARKGLIQKFPMPLAVFPAAVVLHKVYDVVCGLIAYLMIYTFILLLIGHPLPTSYVAFLLPVWVVFFLIITMGVGFILARIGVYFADIRDILEILLRLGFFINPVFLKIDMYSVKTQQIYFLLNPLGGYFVYFRKVLLGGDAILHNYQIPLPYYALYLGVVSIVIFILGFMFFLNGERQYAKYI